MGRGFGVGLRYVVLLGVFLFGVVFGFCLNYFLGICYRYRVVVVRVEGDSFLGRVVGYPFDFFKVGVSVRFMGFDFRVLGVRYTGSRMVTDLPYEALVEIVFPDGWIGRVNVLFDGYVSVGFTRFYIVEHGDMKAGILVIEGEEVVLLVKKSG